MAQGQHSLKSGFLLCGQRSLYSVAATRHPAHSPFALNDDTQLCFGSEMI